MNQDACELHKYLGDMTSLENEFDGFTHYGHFIPDLKEITLEGIYLVGETIPMRISPSILNNNEYFVIHSFDEERRNIPRFKYYWYQDSMTSIAKIIAHTTIGGGYTVCIVRIIARAIVNTEVNEGSDERIYVPHHSSGKQSLPDLRSLFRDKF